MKYPIVIVPGYANSNEGHWQRFFLEKIENSHWAELGNWDAPKKELWVKNLDSAIRKMGDGVVLVCHSLGCLTAAHWLAQYDLPIKAVFFVSIPDPHGKNFPPSISGFEEIPKGRLRVPGIAVASSNDPYAKIEWAKKVAIGWGLEFVDLGAKGHINIDAGFGEWEEGLLMVERLCSKI